MSHSHFQQRDGTVQSVEEELWLIFTHYALHFDPTLPEQWKSATFVKFAKDCQIVSPLSLHGGRSAYGLTVPVLELEIAKLAKCKSKIEIEKDYSPSSVAIDFSDFLSLISDISIKVYPGESVTVATRRVLLENVLPLASRRSLLSLRFDCRDPDSCKVLKQFSKPLRHIFDYYLGKAEIRRNAWVADQVTLVSKLQGMVSVAPAILEEERRKMCAMKDIVRLQRDMISYKEFMQFAQDFSLKSTSFLTSLQVADIFLQVAPLDTELKSTKGMNYEALCDALVYMAHLAYRPLSHSMSNNTKNGGNKVKALLLHAWKALNSHDRNSRLLKEHVHIATSLMTPNGTHDIYGSGMFSEVFLSVWQADNFKEYSEPDDLPSVETLTSGSKIIKNFIKQESMRESISTTEVKREGSYSGAGSQLSSNQQRSNLSGAGSRIEKEDPISSLLPKETVTLRSSQISALLQLKPELAEFIRLELRDRL